MSEERLVNRGKPDAGAAERGKLMKKAGQGNRDACEQLYARMEADGTAESFVRSLTDTAFQVRTTAHPNLVVSEAFRRKLQRMREELGWQTATPLERLLIERIVLCWHHLHQMETGFATASQGSMSLDKGLFFQKVLDKAQKRYLQAVQSLALIRKLQLPAVQVNIGEKQVNVVQGGPPASGEKKMLGEGSGHEQTGQN